MSRYRRAITAGETFFFTVVAYRRQPILCDEAIRTALRVAVLSVRSSELFAIDAWMPLPNRRLNFRVISINLFN
jgi:putative transposase